VPAEAKRVYVDVKHKATDAVQRVRGAAYDADGEMGEWPETTGYVTGGSAQ